MIMLTHQQPQGALDGHPADFGNEPGEAHVHQRAQLVLGIVCQHMHHILSCARRAGAHPRHGPLQDAVGIEPEHPPGLPQPEQV